MGDPLFDSDETTPLPPRPGEPDSSALRPPAELICFAGRYRIVKSLGKFCVSTRDGVEPLKSFETMRDAVAYTKDRQRTDRRRETRWGPRVQ